MDGQKPRSLTSLMAENGLNVDISPQNLYAGEYYPSSVSTNYEELGKYDDNLTWGANQEYARGRSQRGWNLLPTATGRLIGSTLTKFAEGIATIPTAFSANPVSELINEGEKHILDEWLPVYSTEAMDSDSLLARIREPGWWASTGMDGAAFFLSAIAGTKGINAITKIPKIARLAKTLGASDDILMNIDKLQRSTVGKLLALDKPGIAFATGYSAFNEAGFEARGVLEDVKTQTSREKYGKDFEFLNDVEKADVMEIAGEAARQTFWYNVPMLLFSERLFNETVLGNFFGLPESSAFKRMIKDGSKITIKDLTRMQKAALMGLPLAANIPTEMFQENYQLAVQNYFTERSKFGGKMDLLENLQGIGGNMIENLYSIEGRESMFLGGLLGGLGGAFGLGGLSKSEKKAQEYLEILNKGYDNLNKSTSRFFQTDTNPDSPNYGKVVLDAKGRPVMKSQEEIDKDFENLTDEYSKFLYKSTIELINNTNEVGFDILELDKQNSIAELAFKFFEIEDGSKLFEQLIDDYAEKIKKEYGDNYSDKTTKEIADDIKNQVKKLESYYNLANKYYKLDKHPVSLPIQYRSIWKQSFYKETYDKLKKDVTDKIANINPETRIKIDEILKGTIVDKVTNINTQIDKLVNSINDTEIAAVDKLQLANDVKKTLAYNSLLMEEKSEFDNSLTKAKFYEELEAKQKEKDEAEAIEEAKKKSDEIAAQEALKNATPPATDVTGEEKVTPEQGSGVTPVGMEGAGTTGTTGVTGTTGTGVNINIPDVAAAEPGQTAKDTLKNNVLDFIKNKPNVSTTNIKRQFGNDVVTILDELANEGLIDKVKSANGFKYKAKEVQAPASAPVTTVKGQEPITPQQPPAGQVPPSVTPTPVTFSDEVVKEAENIITNEYFGNYPNILNNSNYTSLTKEEAKQVEDLIQQAKNEKWDILKLKDAIKALGFTRSPGVLSEAYDIYLKNRLSGKISVKVFDGSINFKNALMQELADKKSATPVIQPDKDINTEIEKLRKEKENELKPLIKEIKEIEKEIKEIEKEDEGAVKQTSQSLSEFMQTNNISLEMLQNEQQKLIKHLNKLGLELNKEHSFEDIIDKIIDNVKGRFLKQILKGINNLVGHKLKTKFVFSSQPNRKAGGQYFSYTDVVKIYIPNLTLRVFTINKRGVEFQENTNIIEVFNKVFIHELIHAFTVLKIRSDNANAKLNVAKYLFPELEKERLQLSKADEKAIKALNNIFDYIKDNSLLKGEYGVSDVVELVTEALSNEGFAEKLRSISLPIELRYKASVNNVFENIIAYISDLVKNLLNITSETSKGESVLESIAEIVNQFGTSYTESDQVSYMNINKAYQEFNKLAKEEEIKIEGEEIDIKSNIQKNREESLDADSKVFLHTTGEKTNLGIILSNTQNATGFYETISNKPKSTISKKSSNVKVKVKLKASEILNYTFEGKTYSTKVIEEIIKQAKVIGYKAVTFKVILDEGKTATNVIVFDENNVEFLPKNSKEAISKYEEINSQYDKELARELYKEKISDKKRKNFTLSEKNILNNPNILTEEIKDSVKEELNDLKQGPLPEIEKEYTVGDYSKVLQLVKDTIAGKQLSTPENLQLLSNYPKLFKALMDIESKRQELLNSYNANDTNELSSGFKKAIITNINIKFDKKVEKLLKQSTTPTVKSKDRLQQLRNRLEELKQQVKEITERYDKQIAALQSKQVSPQPEVVIIENQVPETIPPEVFSQFMRNGFVTEKVLESIAQKELDGLELSKNEKAIRDEKIKEIEAIKQKLIDKKNQVKDNPDVIVNETEESVDKLELIDLSKYEKMFDANGNVYYVGANGVKVELSKFRLVGRYVTRGDNTLAMRVIEMDKRISYEGDVERHDPNGEIVVLDNNWATTAYMNYDIVKENGELIIRVADNYENVPIYIDPEHKSDVPFGDYIRNEIGKESYLDSLVDNIPLAIYHVFNGKETLIGYVHAVSWVNGTNVAAKPNEISVQRAALKTFRSQFVSEKGDVYATKSVKSKIESVSNGIIAKGKQSKPVGEVLPDFDIYMRVNDNLVSINKDKKIPIKLIKNKEISNIKNGDVGIVEKDFFFFVTKDKLNQDDINILKENIQNLTKEGLEVIKSRVNIISVNSLQEAKQLYDKKSDKNFLFHNKKDNSILLYTNGMLTNDMNNVLSYIDKLKGTTTNVYNNDNKDNLEYLKSKLISPFRQINANYDGNIKPTIFVHPVISFKMTIDMTKPEIKTETEKSPTSTTKRGSLLNERISYRQKDTLNPIKPTSEAEELQKKCKS